MRRTLAMLALLAGGASACTGGGASPAPSPGALADFRPDGIISVGEPIPDCSFRSFDGSVLSLNSLLGKPAVLNFWATWCTFCVKEMPDFERASAALGGEVAIIGFDLLGVDGEIESAARRFARERDVTYPLAFDRGGLLYSHFSVRPSLPTTVFVDAKGIVVERHFGPLTEDDLRDRAREHFGA